MQKPIAAALGAALALSAVGAVQAQEGGRPISVMLSGAAEKPAGDPDGTGMATLRINPGQMQVCYTLKVDKIATPTMAHIHKAAAGAAGPPVLTLTAPANGSSEGCASVSRDLAQALIQTPGDYYVNVHNAEFPGGALRGQLSK